MTLLSAAVAQLGTRLLETALALDPEVRVRLQRLAGKTLHVHVQGFDLDWYLHCTEQTLQISNEATMPVTSHISGTPLALLNMLTSNDTRALFSGEVKLQGDSEFAKQVKRFFDYLNIDWEEHTSRLIGDYPARKLHQLWRGLNAWRSQTTTALSLDSTDYLQEESNLLAHPYAVAEWNSAIDVLRDDFARLEARVQRLSQYLS